MVNLSLNFLGGSAHDDDIGVWNGVGTCETFHGESDCFADLYNLCARKVVPDLSSFWPFTECLFASQQDLCPDTWVVVDGVGQCGASNYSAAVFDPVVEKCGGQAGWDFNTLSSVFQCAVGGDDHAEMSSGGSQLLADNFAASQELDPVGTPFWINVSGTFVDEASYSTPEDWGDAVLAAVCSAYAGEAPPSPACP